MRVIFPMAGRGSRFAAVAQENPEFRKPKPLINVRGVPMIMWSVQSLPFIDLPHRSAQTSFIVKPEELTFICLEEHEEKFAITSVLETYFTNQINVVLIPGVTRGATETALTAKKYIADQESLIISDSDHYFDGNAFYSVINERREDFAGIIPIFMPPDPDPKWSYTLIDKTGRALAVGEKDAELAKNGAYANIGAYFFSKGKTFINEAESMIRENDLYGAKGKQEFYVAPLFERLIKKGFGVQTAMIDRVWGLGTPQDLSYFFENHR